MNSLLNSIKKITKIIVGINQNQLKHNPNNSLKIKKIYSKKHCVKWINGKQGNPHHMSKTSNSVMFKNNLEIIISKKWEVQLSLIIILKREQSMTLFQGNATNQIKDSISPKSILKRKKNTTDIIKMD